MAESPEHEFLKHSTRQILEDFSRLKIYGFTETERRKFDVSCLIERDWSRPLVGQVLWKHLEGVDKDVRILLADTDSEIKLLVARDSIKIRQRFEEVVSDFRRSGRFPDLFRLRSIWVPYDFDADDERQREMIGELVRAAIVQDILFNVVFGNLSEENVRFFLYTSGIPGLNLAILYIIATEGFFNISWLSKRLDVSTGPVREKLLLLHGAGFITTPPGSLAYRTTLRGRVFLDILMRLVFELTKASLSEEMKYILTKLGCKIVPLEEVAVAKEVFPRNPYIVLVRTIEEAKRNWGIYLFRSYWNR